MNNKPHGKGEFTNDFGTRYRGDFKSGYLHGKGELIDSESNRLIFKGERDWNRMSKGI